MKKTDALPRPAAMFATRRSHRETSSSDHRGVRGVWIHTLCMMIFAYLLAACQGGTRPDLDQAAPNMRGISRAETSVTTMAAGANPMCNSGLTLVGFNGNSPVAGGGALLHGVDYTIAPGLNRTPDAGLTEVHPQPPGTPGFLFHGTVMGASLPAGWRSRADPSVGTSAPSSSPNTQPATRILYGSVIECFDEAMCANTKPSEPASTAVAVFRSDDCGSTWQSTIIGVAATPGLARGTLPNLLDPSRPIQVLSFDTPFLYVDPVRRNVVYVIETSLVAHNIGLGIFLVARSLDGGATFPDGFHRVQVAMETNATQIAFSEPQGQFPVLASRGSTAPSNEFSMDSLMLVWHQGPVGGGVDSSHATRWMISRSHDEGATWEVPHAIDPGDPSAPGGIFGRTANVLANGLSNTSTRPGFVVSPAGVAAVAVSRRNFSRSAEQVVVFTSSDTLTWQTGLEIPVGASNDNESMNTAHDQFQPILVRDRFNLSSNDVVLAWYDSRESADRSQMGVYSLYSAYAGLAGTWVGTGATQTVPLTDAGIRSAIQRVSSVIWTPRLLGGGRYGEYIGGDVLPDQEGVSAYVFAWADSRPSLGVPTNPNVTSVVLGTLTLEAPH